jgi:hypothetical protein
VQAYPSQRHSHLLIAACSGHPLVNVLPLARLSAVTPKYPEDIRVEVGTLQRGSRGVGCGLEGWTPCHNLSYHAYVALLDFLVAVVGRDEHGPLVGLLQIS